MKPIIFNQAREIWNRLAVGHQLKEVKIELEAHKKILNIFQAGDFYYYVFNVKDSKFDFMSREVEQILGYKPGELSLEFFLDIIHPEDQSWFLRFENEVTRFFGKLTIEQVPNYKVRYDYRVRKSDGQYIRILQQVVTIEYSQVGGVFRTFGVHTDISHLKTEGTPVLSFIGLNGEPSFIDVVARNSLAENTSAITEREKEILVKLVEGKKTKEIAFDLFLSPETVSTHRKNLIRKTNAKNTADLTAMAIKKGWI